MRSEEDAHGWDVSDRQLLKAVKEATEAGDVQLNGYPSSVDVAEHCALTPDSVNDRLRRAAKAGDVRRHRSVSRSGGDCMTIELVVDPEDGGADDAA
jgi:hypothetical protein